MGVGCTEESASVTVAASAVPQRVVLDARPQAALRLYGVPPAGAGPDCYLRWVPLLPSWIEPCSVALPGRGARSAEPSLTAPSVLNVAVPDLQGDLDTSTAQVQWIVDGYALVLGGTVPAVGAFTDAMTLTAVVAGAVTLVTAAAAARRLGRPVRTAPGSPATAVSPYRPRPGPGTRRTRPDRATSHSFGGAFKAVARAPGRRR
ncbi:hypothetical protein RM550_02300 [Streptomyces sp. DSM 41527]|uniref:MFS transporter n=1 Tax=Streptomyces mooreae TaxID=3075523 RepID=A0ABU2T005_9ACTN|nr:hypothetical protein [Streptomyces sp. DSM 41527]MDT0454569.1 hypothetical protein [Streptomyces sp. DSM 41527]